MSCPDPSNDRVSLPTPKRARVTAQKRCKKINQSIFNGKFPTQKTIDQSSNQDPHFQNQESQWIPQRVINCGKLVGLSIENCKRGSSNLVEFAVARKKQNREDIKVVKSRKKGARELNSLVCSINYDRNRECQADFHPSVEGVGRNRGILNHMNEDSLVECARSKT